MKKTVTIVKALIFSFAIGIAPLSLVKAQKKERTELSVKNFPKRITTSSMGNFSADFSGQNIPSDYLINHLGEWLGSNGDHSFSLVKTATDELGIKHSVYQHYFKNTKVMDDVISVHEKDGMVTFVNGEFINSTDFNTAAQLSDQEVKQIISNEKNTASENLTFGTAENVIAKVYAGKDVKLYNTTTVATSSLKPLFSEVIYIDNNTKKIVKTLSQIYHADTPSVSTTYYKGNQSITVDSYNGSYRLLDNARKIHTYDATGFTGQLGLDAGGNLVLAGSTEYTNSSANFTSAATKAPVEVHWAIKSSYDYYLNKFNRNSFDGNGSAINNYYNMDFSKLSSSYPAGYGFNATAVKLANGMQFMAFGNGNLPGSPGATNTLASIDVGGHEYSHMIIDRNGTGGLNYQSESGALNESFADIFGTAIEFYGAPASANWTVGEGVLNVSPGYIRSMSNPNSANPALGQQPDTYNGTYWVSVVGCTPSGQTNDYCGVHTNSGVGNYWFYLLSQGGSGTNDLGTAFNVTGVTLAKAEKIAYKTLTTYLTPNSTFLDAYNGTKQAAADLFGANAPEIQQVENAWCAVGVGNCQTILAVKDTSEISNEIRVYPNPVKNGVFTIENTKNDVTFEIYDVSGKLVKQNEKLNKGTNKINTSGFQKGIYIIKISVNGTAVSKKIVVE
ncbi:M4 family metallopeptidase [Chryseobacterium mucoviscidosis]|uniref:M4 family metallopeptidase n=1 Tax=Chryseobacterium mucoviscidosis TaxID=1945581 RepID=UPI0030174B08